MRPVGFFYKVFFFLLHENLVVLVQTPEDELHYTTLIEVIPELPRQDPLVFRNKGHQIRCTKPAYALGNRGERKNGIFFVQILK